MAESEYVVALTTLAATADAAAFATTLVEERLAACVNVLPEMQSVYRWEGKLERERERQVIIKTTNDRLPALERRIAELHPYAVPEFLVLSVASGSERYLRWIDDSTGD